MSHKTKLSLLLSLAATSFCVAPAQAGTNNFTVDRQYKGPVCITVDRNTAGTISVQWGSYRRSEAIQSPKVTSGGYVDVQLQARGNNVTNIVFTSPGSAKFRYGNCSTWMAELKRW
jgi:hypothetical protein